MIGCCKDRNLDSGGARPNCPACEQVGRPVDRVTLEHLLLSLRVADIQCRQYYFCRTLTCNVVYYSEERSQSFLKTDLKVRVGLKETEDPIPLCYCFDHSEKMIYDEIAGTGETRIPEMIRSEIKAGNCECEIKNPEGTCCLGNVGRTVKHAKTQLRRVRIAQRQI